MGAAAPMMDDGDCNTDWMPVGDDEADQPLTYVTP